MKTSKPHYLNALKIDEMIRNKIFPSVAKMKRELELSERQILRIIKDMKLNYNAPIVYDKEKKGYCYLLDGFSISDISLNEEESFALQMSNVFLARVLGGSKLYKRISAGLSSLQHRAEVYDNEEGKALADRIHFAVNATNLGADLLYKQQDFETLLFNSIKRGQILKLTKRSWKTKELNQETVLPLFVVLHDGFSWLLFCLKFQAFSADLKSVSMELCNFELIPFSDITAINIYKNGHAKPVEIKNNVTFSCNNAVTSTTEPGLHGGNEKKGASFDFSIQFPELTDAEPYDVLIHFNVDDSFEYVVTENLLDGAYHKGDEPWEKPMRLEHNNLEDLCKNIII